MVMRVLGVQIDYLECTYGTRYYVVNKVNGQINAIHDDSLELTEFKGHLSPFDLDNLDLKICRLAVRDKYEENLFEHQDAFQGHDSDSNLGSQNSEELTGAGFDEIILVQYHWLVKQLHSKELQDQHQHLNQ